MIVMSYERLKSGFFLYPRGTYAKLYFSIMVGHFPVYFPVVHGVISRSSEGVLSIGPTEKVEVLERTDWPRHCISDNPTF